jgi:Holliday junction resolvase RusA-like endonuclease
MIIQFTMPGDVPSLKNSAGMKLSQRKRTQFDNPEVKAYKRDFFYGVSKEFRGKNLGSKSGLLGCIIRIYHRDWRRDADVEIIYDCLQTAGVVLNDRWIRNKLVLGDMLDADNPRAEITLFTLGDPDVFTHITNTLASQFFGHILRYLTPQEFDGSLAQRPSGPGPDGTLPTGKRPRQRRGVRRLPEGA